jgi:hypothetical protein
MKPSHAAALVGWLLLIPPASGVEGGPLNRWQFVNDFRTESDCQAGRQKYYNDGLALMNGARSKATIDEGRRFMSASCISDEDPRLQRD